MSASTPIWGLVSTEAEAAPPSLLTKRPFTRGRAVALRCRHRYTSCLARRILARFARNLREDRECGGGFAKKQVGVLMRLLPFVVGGCGEGGWVVSDGGGGGSGGAGAGVVAVAAWR
jgi:hypothetical protein